MTGSASVGRAIAMATAGTGRGGRTTTIADRIRGKIREAAQRILNSDSREVKMLKGEGFWELLPASYIAQVGGETEAEAQETLLTATITAKVDNGTIQITGPYETSPGAFSAVNYLLLKLDGMEIPAGNIPNGARVEDNVLVVNKSLSLDIVPPGPKR